MLKNFTQTFSKQVLLQAILLFVCFGIGFYNFPLSLVETNFSYMPGDLGDARFINFVLEHGYQYLIGNQPSFYDATFFYPAKNTLALSDNMVGTLPIYTIYRLLDFDRETSYQFWWLSIFVLNYFVAFYCFYKTSKNSYAAILGAYLFTFSIIMFGQCNFTQLNIRFLLPVIILAAYNLVNSNKPKYYYYLVLAVALQFILGVYYAFLSLYLLVIFFACYAIIIRKFNFVTQLFNSKIQSLKTIGYTLATIGLLALYMQNYIEVSKHVNLHKFSDILHLMPTFTSYLIADDASNWAFISNYGRKILSDSWWLNEFFMGIFPIGLLFIYTIYCFKNKDSNKFLVIAFGLSVVCSLLFANKYSLLAIFYYLPGFGSLSVMVRVITVIFTLIVFLNVLFLNDLFLKFKKWSLLIFTGFFILLYFDNQADASKLIRTKKDTILNRYKTIETQIGHTEKNVLAIISENEDIKNFKFHLDAALYAQAHQMKSINGYSSNAPPHFEYFWKNYNRKTLNDWCIYNNIDTNSITIIENKNPVTLVNN